MRYMRGTGIVIGVICLLAGSVPAAGAADVLVAYYSRTGNTAAVCTALAADIGADLVEIKDLHGRQSTWGMIGGMVRTMLNLQTDISPPTTDCSRYRLVVVASPVWASKLTPAVRTWVANSDLAGKRVVVLTTNDNHLPAKYQERNCRVVTDAGADCVDSLQVIVTKQVGDEQVPKNRLELLGDVRALVPRVQALAAGSNGDRVD